MDITQALSSARKKLGYPAEIAASDATILDVFFIAVANYGERPAFSCMGKTLTFTDLDRLSAQFAAYLQQHTNLKPGDRIALQLPNILQYPVAMFGALRAGLVIVNTNPLYTPREMQHQFADSGARAIVVLVNMAKKVQDVLANTQLSYVFVTEMGDLHPLPKRLLINAAVKYVKKMVPAYELPQAISLQHSLSKMHGKQPTKVTLKKNDIALLQYTGGTTGIAKGAVLTHANLIANMLQCEPYLERAGIGKKAEVIIAPLPLYHIYAFMLHCVSMLAHGSHSVLIPNPRDMTAFIKEMTHYRFSMFVGLNTLFVGLMAHAKFAELDFSNLKLTMSGGMALTEAAASRWQEATGCAVLEGYGLTESSPVVSINPAGHARIGTIGLAVPSTEIKIISDDGESLPVGEIGELCVRGPQVTQGYWQNAEATSKTIIDGWLYTGDIAQVEADGFMRIVDRKKDMIIVSGFNVYPNEIENVVAMHPDVMECAAIGVPDSGSGETVKLFVVARNASLTAEALRAFAKENLTAYKVPRQIEFRNELPKSNVGKVLRRELR